MRDHELASVDCVDRWSCDFEYWGFYSTLAKSLLEYSGRLLQVSLNFSAKKLHLFKFTLGKVQFLYGNRKFYEKLQNYEFEFLRLIPESQNRKNHEFTKIAKITNSQNRKNDEFTKIAKNVNKQKT